MMDQATQKCDFHSDHGLLAMLRQALEEEGVECTAEEIEVDPAAIRPLLDDESPMVQALSKLLRHFGILGIVEVDWEAHVDDYMEERLHNAWEQYAATEWGRICDQRWEAFVEENYVEQTEDSLDADWIEHADSVWGNKARDREYAEWARAEYPAWVEAEREAWRERWEAQQWPSWEEERRWAWKSEAYSEWLGTHGPEWQRLERARLESCPWVRVVDRGQPRYAEFAESCGYWALPPSAPYHPDHSSVIEELRAVIRPRAAG